MPGQRVEGTALDTADTPVEKPNGELRRNRRHLNLLPETSEAGNQGDNAVPDQASPSVKNTSYVQTTTPTTPKKTMRSGRKIRLPERFKIRDSELYFVYSGEKFISDLKGR